MKQADCLVLGALGLNGVGMGGVMCNLTALFGKFGFCSLCARMIKKEKLWYESIRGGREIAIILL